MSEPSESTPSRPATPIGALPDHIPNARQTYRFNWDTGIRRPGPESVADTTEGGRGADQFSAQPRLGFLNTPSSTTLVMNSIPSEWSSAKHGFHAISTVLNNPYKKQAPPKAHSSLPAVPPTDLPRVRRKDFDSYLKAITPEWERFERNIKLGPDEAAQSEEAAASTPRASTSADGPTTLPVLKDSLAPHLITISKALPSLDSVPPIFFHQKLDLSNPQTFASVTEQDLGGIGEVSDPSALANSHQLLEKLSYHADTVEQHLIREIAIRSSSFFSALTNLNELQTESEQCLGRIATLRQSLKEVDDKVAKKGLEVVRVECKVKNIEKAKEGVKLVGSVVEMSGVAKGLVNAGQWGEALDVIEELEDMWKEEAEIPSLQLTVPERKSRRRASTLSSISISLPTTLEEESLDSAKPKVHVPLSSLNAFSSLPSHLRSLKTEITTSLSSELVSVLRTDLEECTSSHSEAPEDNIKLSLPDRLRPALRGLVRTHAVKEAALSWREVAMGEIKNIMRKQFPTLEWDEEDKAARVEGRVGLANHLRQMSHIEFIDVLKRVYTVLLKAIEGIQYQNKTVLDVLETLDNAHTPTIASIEDELTDLLSSSAELANIQAANVILPRAEQHSHLEFPEFLTFFYESWNFVLKCEVICRRMIVGLRGVVVSQSKLFLQTFHQTRLSLSAKLVEDEQWNPAEVSPSIQRYANVILDAAVRDPLELIVRAEGTEAPSAVPSPPTNGASAPAQAPSSPSQSTKKVNGSATKHLTIEDRQYFVVSATIEVLLLLLDYLKVIVNLSMVTTDTMSRVIEFLKAFNSRTCQVVLGAGAMRSAGLKNITAKHLALASQSLSVMSDLIPYVREAFRRHLSPKQAVMLIDFDKLKRDYQEHQNEIHSKLIAIMGDRLTAHIATLQEIDWNVPRPGVNEYMELLIKETVTLHKVLSRYLSTQIVEYVMTQVFAAINHRLSEEYGKVELPNQAAKDRLLEDARYLHRKLSALKNVGTPSAMLETIVMEKSLPRRAVPNRSSTIYNVSNSAHQRLKGLLAKSATMDKALPTSSPSETPPRRSTSPKPLSGSNLSVTNGSGSSLMTPSQNLSTTSLVELGYKQVDDEPIPMQNGLLKSAPQPQTPNDTSNLPASHAEDFNQNYASSEAPKPQRSDPVPDTPNAEAIHASERESVT